MEKEQDGDGKLQHTLRNAERSVIDADFQVFDLASFRKLKHVGPKVAEVHRIKQLPHILGQFVE